MSDLDDKNASGKDENVVALKDKFKLVTDKVLNAVTGGDPTLIIDDHILIKCFMHSEFYKAFAQLYPKKNWLHFERMDTGYKLSLSEREK